MAGAALGDEGNAAGKRAERLKDALQSRGLAGDAIDVARGEAAGVAGPKHDEPLAGRGDGLHEGVGDEGWCC